MIARVLGAGALTAVLMTPAFADPHPHASRVLAIGGSVTEIIYALGQEDRLIARDTTSSYPAEVQQLPDVGYMRALSPEGVMSVKPDLIIAEDGAGPPEAIAVLQEAGIPFESIPSGTDAAGLTAKIEAVAEALGVPEAAEKPVSELQAELAELSKSTEGKDQPKRAMFILSLQGGRVMAAGQGTEADGIIRLAGAENAVQGVEGYKLLTDEAIVAAAPDAIVMMKRGESDSEHGGNADALKAIPALAQIPAVTNNAGIQMDGLYLLGFGPRTAQAAKDLHDAIYGDK